MDAQVTVRCRPVSKAERRDGQFSITRLVDDKVVVVMNPDEVGMPGSYIPRREEGVDS